MRNNTLSCLLVLVMVMALGCTHVLADNLAAINAHNRAVDLAYSGAYMPALNETDAALRENENFTLAHVTRAGVLNALGRYEDSIRASEQALALDPNQSAAWNNRAYALIHLGRYDEGLEAAERAAMLDPALTEAWINQGTALIALGRYNEARTVSGHALLLDPGSEEARQNLQIAEESGTNPAPTRTALPALVPLAASALAVVAGWSRRKNS